MASARNSKYEGEGAFAIFEYEPGKYALRVAITNEYLHERLSEEMGAAARSGKNYKLVCLYENVNIALAQERMIETLNRLNSGKKVNLQKILEDDEHL